MARSLPFISKMPNKEIDNIAKMIRNLRAKQEEASQKVKLAADELKKKQVGLLVILTLF